MFYSIKTHHLNIKHQNTIIGVIESMDFANIGPHIEGFVYRARFAKTYIPTHFYKDFITSTMQRISFDIEIVQKSDNATQIIKNVWIVETGLQFCHEDFIILSDAGPTDSMAKFGFSFEGEEIV